MEPNPKIQELCAKISEVIKLREQQAQDSKLQEELADVERKLRNSLDAELRVMAFS